MPLIVEDGTGVADANSYASVEFADAYHLLRNHTDWAEFTDADKEARLVTATDYIELRFGHRFIGDAVETGQALHWPRDGTYTFQGLIAQVPTGVPESLKRATVEYARRLTPAGLMPDPPTPNEGVVTRLREKVGPLETETYYDRKHPGNAIQQYPYVDLMLTHLLLPSTMRNGGVIRN